MGLRNRIMLLVALGLLISTVPLGVMGLGMVGAATDRVLEERLALTRATADHLGQQVAQGWWLLGEMSTQIAAGRPGGPSLGAEKILAAHAQSTTLFSGGFLLVDRTGTVLAQAPASSHIRPLVRSPVLRAVLRLQEAQSSGIQRAADGRPVVLFAVPVADRGGTLAGALVGVIDLSQPTLLAFIAGVAQGTSGHAAIVAHDGQVLASTDDAELYTRNEHPDFFARFIAGGRPLVGPAREDHGSDRTSETHIMAFAPVATVPWGLGIGQSEEETFGPIRRLRDRVIVYEILVLLVALLFAWIDTSAVAAPLTALKAATERIAEGDLNHGIAVRRGDEIGALARSFETMRGRLQRSLDENARLQERLQSVAMVEERERIAREMHDSVGQVLGYVNTKAQAVTVLLEQGKNPEARAQLRQLETAAREVYVDLREAILGLRAAKRTGALLVSSVTEYAARFAALSGIDVRVVVDGDPSRYIFPPTTELHLMRIIQEALTNVRKHARARKAVVRFSADAGTVVLAVEDDGIGWLSTDGPSQRSGFGLQMMRERAEAVGGTFAVRSRIGGGTDVVVGLAGAERGAEVAGSPR